MLFINILFIIIIQIWRNNNTLFEKHYKAGVVFTYLGITFAILSFFLSVFVESFAAEKLYRLDHPCWNYNYEKKARILAEQKEKKEDLNSLCQPPNNKFFYRKKSSNTDYILSYLSPSIIEIFSLIGVFLWFNNSRRIKFYIEDVAVKETGIIAYGAGGSYKGFYFSKGTYKGINGSFYDKFGKEIVTEKKKTGAIKVNGNISENEQKVSSTKRTNRTNDRAQKKKRYNIQNNSVYNQNSSDKNTKNTNPNQKTYNKNFSYNNNYYQQKSENNSYFNQNSPKNNNNYNQQISENKNENQSVQNNNNMKESQVKLNVNEEIKSGKSINDNKIQETSETKKKEEESESSVEEYED